MEVMYPIYTYFDAMNHYIYDSDIDSLPNELTLSEYEATRRQTTPTETDSLTYTISPSPSSERGTFFQEDNDDIVEIDLSSIEKKKKKNIFIRIISSLDMCFKRKLQQ